MASMPVSVTVGFGGGNINASETRALCNEYFDTFDQILNYIKQINDWQRHTTHIWLRTSNDGKRVLASVAMREQRRKKSNLKQKTKRIGNIVPIRFWRWL